MPRGTMEDAGIDPAPLTAMESAVRAGEFQKIGSVLIARHGKIAYEAYFDGDAGTLRDTRSAAKSIGDILTGIAIDQHRLTGVDAPVLSFFLERKIANPDPRKERMTVEDLLTMSNPLECDDWNDASRGNEERMYLVEDWTKFFLDLPIRGRMRIPGEPATPAYGRHFSYCTAGVFTLGAVLEKSTGIYLDKFAETNLFNPLGIQTAAWIYSPFDIPALGGGLRLNTPDWAKLAQLYLNGGTWNGKRIVSEQWVKQSITPHARIDSQTDYGYLWWLKSFQSKNGAAYPAFFMSGNGGNKVVGIPSLDAVVVITSTNYNTRGMHEQTEKLLTDYILPAIKP